MIYSYMTAHDSVYYELAWQKFFEKIQLLDSGDGLNCLQDGVSGIESGFRRNGREDSCRATI